MINRSSDCGGHGNDSFAPEARNMARTAMTENTFWPPLNWRYVDKSILLDNYSIEVSLKKGQSGIFQGVPNEIRETRRPR